MVSNSFYVDTLGCPKNEVDTRMIKKVLLLSGNSVTNDAKKADIVIVNTCGFLQEALEEAFERIAYWKRKKKKIIVTGCAVERLGVKAFEKKGVVAYYLDSLLGIDGYEQVKKQRALPHCDNQIYDEGRLFHYLKVQEGCKRRCSYCVISRIRGPLRSRSTKDILKEIEIAKEKGALEIVLIAQDLTLYGVDTGDSLVNLLRGLPGGLYYRLMYLHPHGITEELVKTLAEKDVFLPYIHIPIQHVSNRVLKDMGRAGGERAVKRCLELVRKYLPHYFIRVDVMVGFPTEEDRDFENLLNFLEIFRPERIAVFKYSHEPGVPSFNLADLPEDVKSERYQICFDLAQDIMHKAQKSLLGKEIIAFKDTPFTWSQYDAVSIDFEVEIKNVRDRKWSGKVKITEVLDTLDVVGLPVLP
ncbi:MAG: MiaB/RimO family radical SAM methylthiotransferase [candidate division WOR-3 bacterium]